MQGNRDDFPKIRVSSQKEQGKTAQTTSKFAVNLLAIYARHGGGFCLDAELKDGALWVFPLNGSSKNSPAVAC
ncbi:MAG: hypothetical protein KBE65_15830 [Phycisphaerae bacterium]|nr:hypothetical protein [Phycisphaerae bacterium]